MSKIGFMLLVFTPVFCFGQDSLRITDCGRALRSFYLDMDVMDKWQSGRHINWQTGEPDDPDAVSGIKTHCSAFVAAACERQGVYILRPPEHRQELLANAQFSWLNSEQAAGSGWHPIRKNILYEAQRMADEGYIVVASTKNPDRHKPGHIALVMPSEVSSEQIQQTGPVLIQTSTKNDEHALFRDAFRRHIKDWSSATDHVFFFYYEKKVQCAVQKINK